MAKRKYESYDVISTEKTGELNIARGLDIRERI